jgi:chromosome segregation ATPase
MNRLRARFAGLQVAHKVTTRRAAALDEHVAVLESAMHAGSDYLKALQALTKWHNTIARQAYMTKLDELKAQRSELNEAAQADKRALRSNGTTIEGLKAQISKLNEAARANRSALESAETTTGELNDVCRATEESLATAQSTISSLNTTQRPSEELMRSQLRNIWLRNSLQTTEIFSHVVAESLHDVLCAVLVTFRRRVDPSSKLTSAIIQPIWRVGKSIEGM